MSHSVLSKNQPQSKRRDSMIKTSHNQNGTPCILLLCSRQVLCDGSRQVFSIIARETQHIRVLPCAAGRLEQMAAGGKNCSIFGVMRSFSEGGRAPGGRPLLPDIESTPAKMVGGFVDYFGGVGWSRAVKESSDGWEDDGLVSAG